jgi:hypothetical protein
LEVANEKQLFPVLSFERLSGNPISGGYDSAILCDRLKALFPDAKILVIFREQRQFLVSCYKQLVREGYAGSLKAFINPPSTGAKMPLFTDNYLKYTHLLNYYYTQFGKENVLALPFELFRRDKNEFFEQLSVFCDRSIHCADTTQQINAADKSFQTWVRSFTNHFFVQDQINPNPIIRMATADRIIRRLCQFAPVKIDRILDRRYQQIPVEYLNEFIAEDNSKLQDMVNIDLKQFGYCLSNARRS